MVNDVRFAFFDDYPYERGHHPDLIVGLGVAAGGRIYCPASFLEGREDTISLIHGTVVGLHSDSQQETHQNLLRSWQDAHQQGANAFVNLFFDENWDSFPVAWQPYPRRVVHVLHRPGELTGTLGGANAEKTGDVLQVLKNLADRDLFVVHTRLAEQQALQMIPTENVVRIGWPSATVAQVESRFAAKANEETAEPYVLLIGEGAAYKGIHCLLDAVREGPVLRIAGTLSVGDADWLAERYPAARVAWEPGWISTERMNELVSGAALVVFPYLEEFGKHGGVSGALVHALAFAKPIIISTALASQAPESEACLVVRCGDVLDLRKSIAWAMKNLDQLGEAARSLKSYVLREHTYESHIARIAERVLA